ncbi:LysR family transcriptional regulator [Cupriavidus basilensis]|uniref:LysR family transcriptional regulator n=1 Tax=Cupriavidus basilensis TaxID=68895 RepID=UPI0023E83900|nr:LysR family transcriptional regulator [Cupriavidus basilensis]MDF3887632.1 LysR family transcriptional regulator [Cupriavidus basilensis]
MSGTIKSLEDELGVMLFERDKTRVQLTPAGAAFLIEVRHVLDSVARARNVAVAVASGMGAARNALERTDRTPGSRRT